MTSRTTWALVLTLVLVASPGFARQSILYNGSMEIGQGANAEDPRAALHWVRFGAVVERSSEINLAPVDGGYALKAFSADPQEGAYQDVEVEPGQQVTVGASLYTKVNDHIGGDAQAGVLLEFYDDNETRIDYYVNIVLNSASPSDTWIPAEIGPITAPAGAVVARIVCVWIWNGSASGAGFWDDCYLTIDGSDNLLLNGDFETPGFSEGTPFGIDGWTGFNDQEQSQDYAEHGEQSLKMTMAADYSGLFQDMGVVRAGDHIYMKALAYQPSDDPLQGDGRAGLKLEFSSVPGTELPEPYENTPFTPDDVEQDVWTYVDLGTTGLEVPEGVNLARIVMIYVGDSATSGSVHFDSVHAATSNAPSVNLLSNASFEDGDGGYNGLDYWTEFSTAGASEAQKSVFVAGVSPYDGWATLKATGTAVAGLYQDVPVIPGDLLNVSAQMFTASNDPFINTNGTASAGVKVEWVGGTVPGAVDIGTGADPNTMVASDVKDEWVELTIDYTMPAGTEAVARFVNILARGTSSSGTVYFDSCEAVVLNRFNGADSDNDDDADLRDFMEFQRCYSGDGMTPLEWGCLVFDSDDDDDIDLIDFAFFQAGMTDPV